MTATMPRQGGGVQLEHSNLRLALNKAKMANGGFSRAAMEETQYLIKKPCADVRDEKKWGVDCAGHMKVKAVIEKHLAMLRRNHMDGCLSSHNGPVKNPQTCRRPKRRGAPPR